MKTHVIVEFRAILDSRGRINKGEFVEVSKLLEEFRGRNSVRFSNAAPGVDGANLPSLLSMKPNKVKELIICVEFVSNISNYPEKDSYMRDRIIRYGKKLSEILEIKESDLLSKTIYSYKY